MATPAPAAGAPARPPREDFDFQAARPPHKETNIIESVGHLVKGCLGGGILGIPEAYAKCGLWASVLFTLIFGVYISYCVNILVSSAQELYVRHKIPQMSYPDLAQMAVEKGPFPKYFKWGKVFRYAVDFIICIDLFGSCCVYEIIIAKTLKQLVDKTDEDGPLNEIRLYILAILLPIILLCMIRSLKYLAPFTLIADAFIGLAAQRPEWRRLEQEQTDEFEEQRKADLDDKCDILKTRQPAAIIYNFVDVICVIATIVYGMEKAPDIGTMPFFYNFIGFFEFCGVVVFSMEGVGVALPIENNMKHPRHYPYVLVGGMSIVVSFVMITGFFGYWGFGKGVRSPVTLNFPHTLFPTILKGMIAFMIFITFGLNFWAPFNLVWYYLKKRHPEEKHALWERVYRAIIVTVITGIAAAFPDMGNLMGLIGSFCLSNMGFIFPAIIEILVKYEYPGLGCCHWRLWKNLFIMLLGLVLCVSGSFFSAKALFGI